MKFIITIIFLASFSSLAFSENNDPMGLSDYIIKELHSDNNWYNRRLTNHEVDLFRATGFILQDGSVKQIPDEGQSRGGVNIARQPIQQTTPSSANHSDFMKEHKDKKAIAHYSPTTHKIVHKPKPSHHEIAKHTKTKYPEHKESKGTIRVRPTNFPNNPTRDEIVKMQQHIQHIERTVGKALDLSLSAYAVAELPQATEGRSGISIGFSGSDGKSGAAVGYSSNFGDKHEYTVKISLSHAGHTDAMGAGFGWQW